MYRRLSAAALSAFVLVATACGAKKLPTAPSDLSEGVVIYIDRDFKGTSAHLTSDIKNLRDYTGPCSSEYYDPNVTGNTRYEYTWDNCISSIRVAPGWRAVLYGDNDYKGSEIEVISDVADLRRVSGRCEEGLNDCVSSIRVSLR